MTMPNIFLRFFFFFWFLVPVFLFRLVYVEYCCLQSTSFIDEMELDIVCKIISAAIWYTLAEVVEMSPK